jgi:hypothetical protein
MELQAGAPADRKSGVDILKPLPPALAEIDITRNEREDEKDVARRHAQLLLGHKRPLVSVSASTVT